MNQPGLKLIAAALAGAILLAGCGEKKSAEEMKAEVQGKK